MPEQCIRETTYGLVQGECREGICVWRGIPYAAAPSGALRFMKPEPCASWEGIRNTSEFGPMCAQVRSTEGRAAVGTMSEDCLSLNIWSPAQNGEKLPVFFYIHGGTFVEGAGSDREYEGTELAKAVIAASSEAKSAGSFSFAYELEQSLKDKIIADFKTV